MFCLCRYGVMGGKVTRHIAFPEKLDLRPYMSKLDAGSLLYQLYGVLVHDGHSTTSGHYYCYIMTAKGDWYCMNDHMVGSCFTACVFACFSVTYHCNMLNFLCSFNFIF